MADYLSIANGALELVGAEDTIVSPDQDSHAARTIANVWVDTRREALRGNERFAPKWNFARSYAELPARVPGATDPIPHGWTSAYRLPSDNVRFDEIVYPKSAIADYQLIGGTQGGELLTRTAGPLKIWYIRDIENPALWDASFVAAFKHLLAYMVADRVTGDRGRKDDCYKGYVAKLSAAAKVDARENPPVEPEEDDWVLARLGGRRW